MGFVSSGLAVEIYNGALLQNAANRVSDQMLRSDVVKTNGVVGNSGESAVEADTFEIPSQLPPLDAVHHLDESDPAFQMCAEIGDPVAVLQLRTLTDAVGENGLLRAPM